MNIHPVKVNIELQIETQISTSILIAKTLTYNNSIRIHSATKKCVDDILYYELKCWYLVTFMTTFAHSFSQTFKESHF